MTRMSNQIDVENARKRRCRTSVPKLLSLRTAADALPASRSGRARRTAPAATTRRTRSPPRPARQGQLPIRCSAARDRARSTSTSATAGMREFGAANAGVEHVRGQDHDADRPDDAAGRSSASTAGQTISLSGPRAAPSPRARLTVTGSTTLDNLRTWVQSRCPAPTVKVETGGRIPSRARVGSDQEVTAPVVLHGGRGGRRSTRRSASSTQIGAAAPASARSGQRRRST